MSWVLVLIAPFAGGLIYGLERKLKARMQGRVGPPVMQPFFDFLKFANKRSMVIGEYHAFLGVLHFFAVYAAVIMLFFGGDILIVIFTHLLATLFLIVAAYSVDSVYSHLGANRELILVALYEPIFALCTICFFITGGSFEVANIISSQPAIYKYPFVFLALLAAIAIKLKKSPFDAADAHQEIVGGVEIEYSGLYFEALYTAKWLDYVYAYSFCFLFGGFNFFTGTILAVCAFLILNILDNTTARVKHGDVVVIFAKYIYPIAVLNIIVAGWSK